MSPSTRRMAAEASAPDCRTISCHAASPFELFPTWTFHRPAIAGIGASPTGAGANRLAWNGYGAPRVPREYWPSSRPSFSVASTFVPYSSKLRMSAPFSNEPVVDVTFSSPLKNDPLIALPDPAISKRNGTSMPPLTTTEASHSPLIDCASTRAGRAARTSSAATNRRGSVLFIQCSCLSAVAHCARRTKEKARKAVCLPGLRYDCEPVGVPNSYERTTSVDAARCRPEASPATQHEHSQQRTTN